LGISMELTLARPSAMIVSLRFIKNFADIAAPLHDLPKGGQPEFCWTPVADEAFNDLKSRLCSAPILSLPDFSVPFTIYTDARDFGLGAVLSQRRGENEYVIAYDSWTFTPAERNYSTTEKKCLAIAWTVNYWRPYLLGKTFDIVTDHQSLTWLQGLKEPKDRLARWILALQEYDFEIRHRPDQSEDEDLMVAVNGTEVCTSWSKAEIIKAQQDDPRFSGIMQKLSCSDDLPEERNDHDNSKEIGERRRCRQLCSQLEMVDGFYTVV
ncbi:retrotransposable element, partial [Paramuricea clavata]